MNILKTFKFSLCNIYAPNNAALQKAYIENLTEMLISNTDISNLITVGGWNVTLEAVGKKVGIQWKPKIQLRFLSNVSWNIIWNRSNYFKE